MPVPPCETIGPPHIYNEKQTVTSLAVLLNPDVREQFEAIPPPKKPKSFFLAKKASDKDRDKIRVNVCQTLQDGERDELLKGSSFTQSCFHWWPTGVGMMWLVI